MDRLSDEYLVSELRAFEPNTTSKVSALTFCSCLHRAEGSYMLFGLLVRHSKLEMRRPRHGSSPQADTG
eukprot:11252055-Alexandrium_andersonii.AAC.1